MRDIFGIFLILIQLSILFPLITRAWRTRSGDGVSLSGESMWAIAGTGWMAYGALSGSTTLVVSGVIAATGSAATWLLVRRSKIPVERRKAVTRAGLVAASLSLAWLFAGLAGLSAALAIFGVVQFLPQARENWNSWRLRTSTVGVSVPASLLRSAYTAGWAAYAMAWAAYEPIDWPLATWGVAGAVVFATQAMVAWSGRKTTRVVSAQEVAGH